MLSRLQARIQTTIVKSIRQAGQSLERWGIMLEVNPYVEHLQPATTKISFNSKVPSVAASFVAPCATIVGDVRVIKPVVHTALSSVSGDVNTIQIGEGTSIGDRTVVHVSGLRSNKPAVIGSHVTIGAGAMIHGCTLEDECMVLDGAIILDGAVVHKHAVVAPGAVVGSGKQVLSGQIWAGVPAEYLRDVSETEMAYITSQAAETITLALAHAEENSKPWQQIEAEQESYEDRIRRSPHYFQPLPKSELEYREGYVDGKPYKGRIFNSDQSNK